MFQLADLVVTRVSPRYGDAHLDHLGVPYPLRPILPVVKGGAVLALVGSARRSPVRRATGAALIAYYSAAVTFHARSGDDIGDLAPAALCGVLAAGLALAPAEPVVESALSPRRRRR